MCSRLPFRHELACRVGGGAVVARVPAKMRSMKATWVVLEQLSCMRLSGLDVATAMRPPARSTVRSALWSDDHSRRRFTIMAVHHSTKATRMILLRAT